MPDIDYLGRGGAGDVRDRVGVLEAIPPTPGPQGPSGPQGSQGVQGPTGPSGIILPGRVVTTGTTIAITKNDGVVLIASPDATAATLPSDAQDLQQFFIKDALGICASKPIIITSQTGPIDGASSFPLILNYQTLTLVHVAGTWSIL